MDNRTERKHIVGKEDLILITGASGFIGSKVVARLLDLGFCNLRCFVRPAGSAAKRRLLQSGAREGVRVEVVEGNLLSKQDCARAVEKAAVILHLAAGRGEKSYPDAVLNSVVTTRNLLDAAVEQGCMRRFVNISSFSVYSNQNKSQRNVLDESCEMEARPQYRDAYTFAKVKQDELVMEYSDKFQLSCVIVRPGHVYGPGNEAISARVGVGTFGRFLHMGGPNTVPFTYVDNCADAIVLAGVIEGVDGEVFNVVDDDLPSSRQFLALYRQKVRQFKSVYLPHTMSYLLCWSWQALAEWSQGQVPPAFNVRRWHAFWKETKYSNQKLKDRLGWTPRIAMAEGLSRYFAACRERGAHA